MSNDEWIDPRMIEVNRTPIQNPLSDRLIRKVFYGDKTQRTDCRLILSVAELEKLLDIAKSSTTNRAVLHHVGLNVGLYQSASGHNYEVWTLSGSHVLPEKAPFEG